MTKTKINGEWVTTSSGEQIWTGTKAQLAAGLADGTIPEGTKVMVTNDYDGGPVPVGVVEAYMGATAPEGWLLCDGSTFDTAVYPKLYELLGKDTVPDKYATLDTNWTVVAVTGVPANTTGKSVTFTAEHDGYLSAQIRNTVNGDNFVGLYIYDNGRIVAGGQSGTSEYQAYFGAVPIWKGHTYAITYRNDAGKSYQADYAVKYYNKDPYIIRAE